MVLRSGMSYLAAVLIVGVASAQEYPVPAPGAGNADSNFVSYDETPEPVFQAVPSEPAVTNFVSDSHSLATASGGSCGYCCDASDGFLDAIFGDEPLLSQLVGQDDCPGALTYQLGGELRYRYMDERNRLRPGVPVSGARTQYNLWRFTPYMSATYNGWLTGYVQAIDASAFGYDPPLTAVPIDINRSDLLRYYAEVKFDDVLGGTVKYRYGRQFLKYGSQHLLSPLGWSNTYRNFEGHKVIYTAGDWTIDGFAMNSVNGAAAGSGFDATGHDEADRDRWMNGIYTTYNGFENNTVDMYWLWSLEENRNGNRHDGDRHTIGMRIAGSKAVKDFCEVVGTWTWDLEGAYQFGEDDYGDVNDQDVQAGFVSLLGGYTFNRARWSPTVGGIFYWGSGDTDSTDGEINTFHSLYPLGHAYWGLIDNFSGQNLLDYGLQASVKPHKKWTLASTFHWFDRATDNDAVYNIVGAPLAGGTAGQSIGNELDLVATYKHSKTLSVQMGYFWFWYGEAINNGAPRPDAKQLYLSTTWAF